MQICDRMRLIYLRLHRSDILVNKKSWFCQGFVTFLIRRNVGLQIRERLRRFRQGWRTSAKALLLAEIPTSWKPAPNSPALPGWAEIWWQPYGPRL
jgi:hypothetical protein